MRSLPFVPADLVPAVIVPVTFASAAQARATAAEVLPTATGSAPGAGVGTDGARAQNADALEWRVDGLRALSEAGATYEALKAHTHAPLIATLRTAFEGGDATVTEDEYADCVTALIDLGPGAVDIEIDRAHSGRLLTHAEAAGHPQASAPRVTTIASHHNFTATPSTDWLVAKFHEMAEAGADVAKIAVMPTNHADVLTLLNALEKVRELPIPVIGIAMGRLGLATRLLAGEFGSAATFAAGPAGASAPGQATVAQVRGVLKILGD